jgi:hypothetical protein
VRTEVAKQVDGLIWKPDVMPEQDEN